MTVYRDPEASTYNEENYQGYSFDNDFAYDMKYSSQFLQEVSENPVGVVLRDSDTKTTQKLL